MAFNKDTVVGTMVFTFVLCLSCSFMITGTAEVLKERKLIKKRDELKRNVLLAADIDLGGDRDFRQRFTQLVRPMLVDLNTGEITSQDKVLDFDDRMAAINPDTSSKPKQDIAKIRRRADKARVFEVLDEQGQPHALVLPIHGKGLWSMIYGFVALKPDLNTIENVVFYEHGETPGIGDFIEDPAWTRKLKGKQLFDARGQVSFKVVKGGAKPGDLHGVDGVSGATMTGRGVQRAVRFWFGVEGYQTFLHQFNASEVLHE